MLKANLTIPVLLLAATVAISVTVSEDAFARSGKYTDDTSQAAVSNNCLNPILDSNSIENVVGVGNCGGTVSQQDESGQASALITSQSANPTVVKPSDNTIYKIIIDGRNSQVLSTSEGTSLESLVGQ
jgi:hypothetical protein